MDVAVFTDEQRCAARARGAARLPALVAFLRPLSHPFPPSFARLFTHCRGGPLPAAQGAPGERRARSPPPPSLPPPRSQEVHRVEEQVRRRVAIGSFVSERKLVDELVRWVGGWVCVRAEGEGLGG